MQYRKFGKLDWNVSVLGFGAMRLPLTSNDRIDEKLATRMMHRAMDGGVNYFDTAWGYHGGQSEAVVGKALADGHRAKAKIATKSPIWEIKESEDFDRILCEQMKRLATDHIDCYMMHGIGSSSWDRILQLGLLDRAERARRAGRIGQIGFSFHDKFSAFQRIVDGYDAWDFCQIQYNYMDTENQAGTAGLRYAAAKGIPVIVMEPVLGGRLANPPPAIRAFFDEFPGKRKAAAWALRWVWNHPEVTTVLSGVSTMDQLEENLRTAAEGFCNVMTEAERAVIAHASAGFSERTVIDCTHCDYCLPCPQGVEIPRVFQLYNSGKMYDDVKGSRFAYERFVPEQARADRCVACGECEAKCPQRIEIGVWMPRVHAVLGLGGAY